MSDVNLYVMKKFVVFLMSLIVFSACTVEEIGRTSFVGKWKDGNSRYEFFSDGSFVVKHNYYEHTELMFKKSGIYSYNAGQQSLSMRYDNSGASYIYVVQSVSEDRIVYFDPTDLYVWTLMRE